MMKKGPTREELAAKMRAAQKAFIQKGREELRAYEAKHRKPGKES